jgi:hypothetical protein
MSEGQDSFDCNRIRDGVLQIRLEQRGCNLMNVYHLAAVENW